MDFEQQLDKAERLDAPSLVGASLRSADDSAHNNYIHPEKSKGKKASKKGKKKDVAASLDDLINEGALLGSEEDFDKFLDDSGNIKDDAKYDGKEEKKEGKNAGKSNDFPRRESAIGSSPLKQVQSVDPIDREVKEEQIDPKVSSNEHTSALRADVYSTPNLSEYQLDNQINNVDDLLSSVKSHDPSRLPKTDSYKSSSIKANKKNLKIHDLDNPQFKVEDQPINSPFKESGLHAPYFHTEERARSRSRSTSRFDRSRSRSNKPHLARGDSYKNIHEEEPSKYEMPPELSEIDERQSRQSRPTMKEKIEQQESEQNQVRQFHNEETTRDPSLVTTGDYSNFNVDTPQQEERFYDSQKIYAQRSMSSTNYLRNISRSRSRQPSHVEEKNDSNPRDLVKEGAFVSDDPYSTIDNLDTMVEEVLHVDEPTSLKNKSNPSDDLKSKTVDQNNVKDLKKKSEKKEDSKVGDKVEEQSRGLDSKAVAKDNVEKDEAHLGGDYVVVDKATIEEGKEPVAGDHVKKDLKSDTLSDTSKDALIEEKQKSQISSKILNADKVDDAGKTAELNSELAPKSGASAKKDTPPSNILISDIVAANFADVAKKRELDDIPKPQEKPVSTKAVSKEAEEQLPSSISKKLDSTDILSDEKEDGSDNGNAKSENTKIAEKELSTDTSTAPVESISTPSRSKNTIRESPEEPLNFKSKVVEKLGSSIASLSASKDQDLSPKVGQESSEDLMAQLMKDLEVESGRVSESEEKELLTVEDKADARDEKEDGEKSTSVLKSGGDIDEQNVKKSTSGIKSEDVNEKGEDDTSKAPEIAEPKAKDLNDVETTESTPQGGILGVGAGILGKIKDTVLPQAEESKDTATSVPKDQDRNIVDASNADSSNAVAQELPKEEVTKSIEPETKVDSDDDFDFDVSPEELRKHLESQPIYLFTSLAGGMQIVPRTNRLATILQANGIKFEYRDLGTDEEAKKIWKRQANGKPLPGVVRGDDFIGNWKEIDDANEEYKLHELLYETL